MKNSLNRQKAAGILLITGAIALLVPYTVLTSRFNYPMVLRQDTAIILTAYYEGGHWLIWTWFAFALAGLPLLPAYVLLGQQLDLKAPLVRLATSLGLIGLVVQLVGLLRWTFVIPLLADAFVHAPDESARGAVILTFRVIHQFGGVLLGEHLGQLFTIAWTVLMTLSFTRLGLFPRWVNGLGLFSSFIYLLAQADLLATVIPDVPVWSMAGLLGSTLWLIWLVIIGTGLVKMKASG